MAKTKAKKSEGKSKGAKRKTKDDKSAAGFKLPKALRNFGPVKDLINSDLGRELLADALIAAAGAAAAALTKKREGGNAKAVAKAAAQGAMQTAAGTVAGVVGDAARHFLPPTLVGDDDEAPAPRRLSTTPRKAPPQKATAKTAGKARRAGAPRASKKASAPTASAPAERNEAPGEGSSEG